MLSASHGRSLPQVSPSLPNTQTADIAIFIEGTKGMKEMERQFLLLMICNAHVWTSQGRGEICGRTSPFPLRAPAHLPTTLPRIQKATDRDSQPPGVENEEFR